ncbi:MAG: TVP38/TMEM64 family protein [Desulfobacca sp.]|uniref:TVP38/TMEM64 family protein n=1 Tax=Desulfobacca sp. TaxID=2067990 RepID=UPI00404AF2C0
MGVVVFVVALGLLLALFWSHIGPWIENWSKFLASKEKVRDWILSYGAAGPLIFVALQAMQVVVAPVPGEATGFLGGYLFGITQGFLFSSLGLAIGSTLAFLLGRWLEIHFVEKIVARETLEKFDFIVERQGTLIAFLLFLTPGFPKDYLCFILGLSKMPLRVFLVIVIIGRMPGTLLLTLQGAAIYTGNYVRFIIMLAIFLLVAVLLLIYKESIYRGLRRWSKKNEAAYAPRQKTGTKKVISSPQP